MEKQYIQEKQKQIPNKELVNVAGASEKNKEEKKAENIKQKASEEKTEITEEKKKNIEIEKVRKKEAIVFGKNLGISIKHSIAICNAIRRKKVDEAVNLLENVLKMKKAIPMKGEIPHRKGMMGGRYPIKAAKQFIKLLKQLAANAIVNNLDLEKARIECKSDLASRLYKRFGSERFKRTHVILKLKEKEEKPQKENEKK